LHAENTGSAVGEETWQNRDHEKSYTNSDKRQLSSINSNILNKKEVTKPHKNGIQDKL
jgi:hypothetical protein